MSLRRQTLNRVKKSIPSTHRLLNSLSESQSIDDLPSSYKLGSRETKVTGTTVTFVLFLGFLFRFFCLIRI